MACRGYSFIKRVADSIGALLGLLLASPVILLSLLLVWIEDPDGSPFIVQERIGLGGKPFFLLKLRTMRNKRYEEGRKLSDAERMLKSGLVFRKLSIDELPQLLNVLIGQMSLIGPRPMPVSYKPYFKPEERVRENVRPGMSGLAQVNGRNYLTWDEKFAYDIEYVTHCGMWLDLKILLLTIHRLLGMSGVGVRGEDLPTASLFDVRQPCLEDNHDT